MSMAADKGKSKTYLVLLVGCIVVRGATGRSPPIAAWPVVLQEAGMSRVRPPVLAGTWYPGDPETLRRAVVTYLAGADARQRPPGRPTMVVVPHAGYLYSGPTAGRVYGLLRGERYERVFVLAPSHRQALTQLALPAEEAFATPLGEVAVDLEATAGLARQAGFAPQAGAHAQEHAIEIQLPFLQVVFGAELRIVPILVPPLDEDVRRHAAAALGLWSDGDALFVVSTDFTHYGAAYGFQPFRDRVPERLRELDGGAIERILSRDAEGLLAYGERTGLTMCGIEATVLALSVKLPRGGAALVDYARSADRQGDYSLSVSYAGMMLSGPAETGEPQEQAAATARSQPAAARAAGSGAEQDEAGSPGGSLAPEESDFLLALARRTVEAAARGKPPPSPERLAGAQGRSLGGRLSEPRGVFVTLTRKGRLRGCIGSLRAERPLAAAVVQNSLAAARHDPRFSPVAPDELAEITVEISILTPLRDVPGPGDIELGRHGILLSKGPARAVFLPQVATEQGWDLNTTLDHLALKAGLPAGAWREGARFQVFEAEIHGEKET
jgi:AmmeMemoRadiSam system protein B/AmmeMemoRadiSam system protein A